MDKLYVDLCDCHSECNDPLDTYNVQATIERSLAVASSKLAQDAAVSGNIDLKNQLHEEMGGKPTTILKGTCGTVA